MRLSIQLPIAKCGTTCAAFTKQGSPYETVPIASFTQNQQPLVFLLQNEEALMRQRPQPHSHKISNPLCCYYKTRKPLWDIAHSLIHTKSATPCAAITKQGSSYEIAPIASLIQNQHFEYHKWYKRASFYHWKSVLVCSLLSYHQLKHKSLYWRYFAEF